MRNIALDKFHMSGYVKSKDVAVQQGLTGPIRLGPNRPAAGIKSAEPLLNNENPG